MSSQRGPGDGGRRQRGGQGAVGGGQGKRGAGEFGRDRMPQARAAQHRMVAVAHPFGGEGEGMTLAPQGGPDSGIIRCPAGQQYCTGAYNTDDDDQAMRDCAQSADLKLTLCG